MTFRIEARPLAWRSLPLALPLVLALPTAAQTPLFDVQGNSEGDHFGQSVAFLDDVDGDLVPDIAVGSSFAETLAFSAGEVRILSGASGALLHTIHGQVQYGRLGTSVASAGDIDGDGYGDLIAGAPYIDELGGFIGPGFALVISGNTGRTLYRLRSKGEGVRFGWSVASIGDLNGDGHSELAVGDPGVFTFASRSSVSIFDGASGALLHEYRGPTDRDQLGHSVAGVGDINLDGVPDFAMGAPHNSTLAHSGGLVRVHSGRDGSLLYQFAGVIEFQRMGTSVAGAGDVNKDGYGDVIVGSASGAYSGSAQVYSGKDGSLLHWLTGGPAHVPSTFGRNVGGLGDVDGDGYDDVIVTGPGGPLVLQNIGSARAFSGRTGGVLFNLTGNGPFDYFGQSLATGADLDGDQKPDFAIGSIQSQSPVTPLNPFGSGNVRVFSAQ